MKEIDINEKQTIEPFYMVYVEGKLAPTKIYNDITKASAEAHRLCKKEHAAAYVLKVVGGYECYEGIGDIVVKEQCIGC